MRWLDYAEGELGQHELRGSQHNPRILEYHSTTTLGDWGRSRDETPWCSSFINWCFVRAGVLALIMRWLGVGSGGAALWQLRDWQLGDVMVVRHREGKGPLCGQQGRVSRHLSVPCGEAVDCGVRWQSERCGELQTV